MATYDLLSRLGKCVLTRKLVLATIALVILDGGGVNAQSTPGKNRLGVRDIRITDSVQRQARESNQSSTLAQIRESLDGQLIHALQQTRKFEIVARSDLEQILKEQDLAASGLVNRNDDQAARAFELAGCRFMATVVIDSFQEVTIRRVFEGAGVVAEKREITLSGVVKIYNTTTGVLHESSSVQIKKAAKPITHNVGERVEGRESNAIIVEVVRELATTAAIRMVDIIYPPKVMAYTAGIITFNRGAGTGVEKDQIWELFAIGEELIDPDTGERLGAEEISIGWAQVVDVRPKYSRARVVQDFGIERGGTLRFRPEGLPDDMAPSELLGGFSAPEASSGGGATRESGYPLKKDQSVDPGRGGLDSKGAPKVAAASRRPLRAAIFIKNRVSSVPANRVMVLEDYLVSAVTKLGLSVISREDSLNAASGIATEGANEGYEKSGLTDVDRMLSDSSSALRLAEAMGADYLLVASITAYDRESREFNDPSIGVKSEVVDTTLDVTYRICRGSDGGSALAGIVTKTDRSRPSSRLITLRDPLNPLLREAASGVAEQLRGLLERVHRAAQSDNGVTMTVRVSCTMTDLSIPEVVRDDKTSQYLVTANNYQLMPLAVNVLVDGLLVGTAPGQFEISPGLHRLRMEREGFQPYERHFKVRPGMNLIVPMSLSETGLRRWREATAFLQDLKRDTILTEAKAEAVRGFATMLRESRVVIDTSKITKLGGSTIVWPGGS